MELYRLRVTSFSLFFLSSITDITDIVTAEKFYIILGLRISASDVVRKICNAEMAATTIFDRDE
jgi:hypothetical protein